MQTHSALAGYKNVVMDMDGVLYRGNSALPGLVEFFGFLDEARLPYLLVTNNATMTAEDYTAKLVKMGVDVPPERIVTSGAATADWLKQQAPEGAGVYVVGMAQLRRAIFGPSDSGGLFYWDEQSPRYVVQGADFNLVYESVKRACLLIRAGAQFVATNADPVYPSEEGLIPGAGSVGALLKTATGQEPFVIGKPEPTMYEIALKRLNATAADTVMIGDNLITDILGATRLGMPTILTLSGVTTEADYAKSGVKADITFTGLPELVAAWRQVL